jgi:hypothetical protein
MIPPNYSPVQHPEELPVLYQTEDTATAFRLIDAGESQAYVDVGGSGKSNFVRHLVRPEVKRQYITGPRRPHQVLMILLNPHQMIHLEENALLTSGRAWPGYELMLNRLKHHVAQIREDLLTAEELHDFADIRRVVETAWKNMFNGSPLYIQSGIRRVEDAIADVLQLSPHWQVVLVLDELEEFLRVLPVEFFQSLRGLRDDHKRRLMYITTSRQPPVDLLRRETDPARYAVLEGFIELFHDFTLYLRPLDDLSAEHSLKRYEYRYKAPLNPQQKEYLRHATGSHIGLMRRGYLASYRAETHRMRREEFVRLLVNSDKVQKDLGSLFDSLSEGERLGLRQIAHGDYNIRQEVAQSLFNKHLVNQRGEIRIPVLQAYILTLNG